jgi:elongation factor Ts
VNCETDFVGRSDDFVSFAAGVADVIEQHSPASIEQLLSLTAWGRKIADLMNDLLSKVAEKVDIRRFAVVEASDGVISAYTHVGNKIGVLVELAGVSPADAATGVGRDIAMQIAAMNPMVVTRDQVSRSMIDKELEIYKTQAANEGKPAAIAEKIATGRLEKFFQEVALMEQTFIKDPSKTIRDFLAETGTKSGTPIAVRQFHRYHLGEEIQ